MISPRNLSLPLVTALYLFVSFVELERGSSEESYFLKRKFLHGTEYMFL